MPDATPDGASFRSERSVKGEEAVRKATAAAAAEIRANAGRTKFLDEQNAKRVDEANKRLSGFTGALTKVTDRIATTAQTIGQTTKQTTSLTGETFFKSEKANLKVLGNAVNLVASDGKGLSSAFANAGELLVGTAEDLTKGFSFANELAPLREKLVSANNQIAVLIEQKKLGNLGKEDSETLLLLQENSERIQAQLDKTAKQIGSGAKSFFKEGGLRIVNEGISGIGDAAAVLISSISDNPVFGFVAKLGIDFVKEFIKEKIESKRRARAERANQDEVLNAQKKSIRIQENDRLQKIKDESEFQETLREKVFNAEIEAINDKKEFETKQQKVREGNEQELFFQRESAFDELKSSLVPGSKAIDNITQDQIDSLAFESFTPEAVPESRPLESFTQIRLENAGITGVTFDEFGKAVILGKLDIDGKEIPREVEVEVDLSVNDKIESKTKKSIQKKIEDEIPIIGQTKEAIKVVKETKGFLSKGIGKATGRFFGRKTKNKDTNVGIGKATGRFFGRKTKNKDTNVGIGKAEGAAVSAIGGVSRVKPIKSSNIKKSQSAMDEIGKLASPKNLFNALKLIGLAVELNIAAPLLLTAGAILIPAAIALSAAGVILSYGMPFLTESLGALAGLNLVLPEALAAAGLLGLIGAIFDVVAIGFAFAISLLAPAIDSLANLFKILTDSFIKIFNTLDPLKLLLLGASIIVLFGAFSLFAIGAAPIVAGVAIFTGAVVVLGIALFGLRKAIGSLDISAVARLIEALNKGDPSGIRAIIDELRELIDVLNDLDLSESDALGLRAIADAANSSAKIENGKNRKSDGLTAADELDSESEAKRSGAILKLANGVSGNTKLLLSKSSDSGSVGNTESRGSPGRSPRNVDPTFIRISEIWQMPGLV